MKIRWRFLLYASIPLILLVISVMAVSVISANGGPHEGTFTTTTDSCAGCHRAHTGQAADLLKSTTQYALCTSCHDGTGATTKVTTGVYLGSTQGTLNKGLRGGGFEQALMNTSVSGTFNEIGTPLNITSKHTIGATGATAWGSGATGSGEAVSLQCGNCHNPHGNSNYRMLRGKPTSLAGYSGLTAVNIAAGLTDSYTIAYNGSHYRDLTGYTTGITGLMADWCSQCHTRYKAGAGSGSTSSGSAPYLYRHMTDTTGECLSCHVAHGSSAAMTGVADNSAITWPDGTATAAWQSVTEGQHSRLLTIDNRGVCLQCHDSVNLNSN